MNLVEKSFVDEAGINRLVLVPEDEPDIRSGIPLSLDLSPLFGHMPLDFQRDLYAALHAQKLVKASDYLQPGAYERFQAALRSVMKHDFLSVQALAKEVRGN